MEQFKNYIAGEWVAAKEALDNVNPSNIEDIIGRYAQADRVQVEQAVDAAAAAFPVWSRAGIQKRADSLDFIGSEILARKEELGRLLSREEGKTLPEGIGEVARAGQIFKFFAAEALRMQGQKGASVRPGVEAEVIREPLGVIGIITRSGLPEGVFNLVMGSGGMVGNTLLQNRQINGISFTGSTETGAKVATDCSQRGAKFQLEMSGKNPLVVLDDADLEVA